MKRRSLLALGLLPAIARAATPMLEAELRWVEQAAPPVGTLTSQRGTIEAAGPSLRLRAGGRAEWELEGPPDLFWAETRTGDRRAGAARAAQPRWRLAIATQWQGPRRPLRVAIEWQGPEPDGGSQRWHSEIEAPLDRWVSVSRSAPRPVAKDTVSTESLRPIRELQLRLRSLPE